MWKGKKKKTHSQHHIVWQVLASEIRGRERKEREKINKKKEMNKAYRNKKHDKTMLIFRMT